MYTAHIHSIRERERERPEGLIHCCLLDAIILWAAHPDAARLPPLHCVAHPAQQQMSCRNGAMETRRKCRPYGSRFSYSLTSGMGDAATAAAPSHYLFSFFLFFLSWAPPPPQLVNMLTPNKKLNSDLTSRFSSFSSYRQFRLRNNVISWGVVPVPCRESRSKSWKRQTQLERWRHCVDITRAERSSWAKFSHYYSKASEIFILCNWFSGTKQKSGFPSLIIKCESFFPI